MGIWKQRKKQVPALPFIVSMRPPGYASAWLRPRRARLRFTRQDHSGSAMSFGLNFRMRRNPPTIGGKLPAELRTSHKRTSGQLSVLRRFQALATESFRMRRHPPGIALVLLLGTTT